MEVSAQNYLMNILIPGIFMKSMVIFKLEIAKDNLPHNTDLSFRISGHIKAIDPRLCYTWHIYFFYYKYIVPWYLSWDCPHAKIHSGSSTLYKVVQDLHITSALYHLQHPV